MNSLKIQGQKPYSMENLKQEILSQFNSQAGTFALAFYDLDNNRGFSIHGDEIFHAASTMKTPVMVELFKKSAAGKFHLTDSVLIRNEFKSIVDQSTYHLSPGDDSDSAIYQFIGKKMSIHDLIYHMIIYSSNLATNMLIELAKPDDIMQTIRKAGAKKMKVLRGVEDGKAYDVGLNNVTTANDLAILFRKIATGTIVNKEACEEMIRILKDQRHNDIIPANLPEDVQVAHKTGNITGVEHDGGIVYLMNGKKYVLVLLSKDLEDRDAAIRMMAEVSRKIYDFINH